MAKPPAGKIYPVICFDGVVFHSCKDNRVINKCVYSALGINLEGRFVPYKDRKAVYADLKKRYGAINLDVAERARDAFREIWDGKYPNILKSCDKNWAELTAFFAYPAEIRRIIIYLTAFSGLSAGDIRWKDRGVTIRRPLHRMIPQPRWVAPQRSHVELLSYITHFFHHNFIYTVYFSYPLETRQLFSKSWRRSFLCAPRPAF